MRALKLDGITHRHVLRDRDRVAQHAGLVTLDLHHLRGLLFGSHVFVNDADTPLLRERNRKPSVGHRIHRRRNERDVQRNVAGELGRKLYVAGEDRRVGGDEQHVIESQRFLYQPHTFPQTQRRIIRDQPDDLAHCSKSRVFTPCLGIRCPCRSPRKRRKMCGAQENVCSLFQM